MSWVVFHCDATRAHERVARGSLAGEQMTTAMVGGRDFGLGMEGRGMPAPPLESKVRANARVRRWTDKRGTSTGERRAKRTTPISTVVTIVGVTDGLTKM